eukprot:5571399-Ditylum_brightwellii.AAC.1
MATIKRNIAVGNDSKEKGKVKKTGVSTTAIASYLLLHNPILNSDVLLRNGLQHTLGPGSS